MGDRQARITIAKQLLDILDLETIAQKTGLTIEEIQQMRSQRLREKVNDW
jgi:hypothetical protein